MAAEGKEFRNTSEEISHWKSLALDYKERYDEMKEEFEEFQSSSKELEMEMEFQIKSLEKQNSELLKQLEKLKDDHAEISEKFGRHRQQTSKTINDLEIELLTAKETVNSQKVRIVKLEIENDKLENSSRATTSSLEYIQQKLDEQTEMVAYLTFEKEDLLVEVERYKEDLRDLQNDIAVRDKPVTGGEISAAIPEVPLAPSSPSRIAVESRYPPFDVQNTPLRTIKSIDKTPGSPLTPQACITAIGIVNDLMKRFGSIESKLAAIRNCNKTTSLIRQKADHNATGENCNGIGGGRQSQLLSRRSEAAQP